MGAVLLCPSGESRSGRGLRLRTSVIGGLRRGAAAARQGRASAGNPRKRNNRDPRGGLSRDPPDRRRRWIRPPENRLVPACRKTGAGHTETAPSAALSARVAPACAGPAPAASTNPVPPPSPQQSARCRFRILASRKSVRNFEGSCSAVKDFSLSACYTARKAAGLRTEAPHRSLAVPPAGQPPRVPRCRPAGIRRVKAACARARASSPAGRVQRRLRAGIRAGAHPGPRPDAACAGAGVDRPKRRPGAGAGSAVTRSFLKAETCLRLRGACRRAGTGAPAVPGIPAVRKRETAHGSARRCGARMPGWPDGAFRAAPRGGGRHGVPAVPARAGIRCGPIGGGAGRPRFRAPDRPRPAGQAVRAPGPSPAGKRPQAGGSQRGSRIPGDRDGRRPGSGHQGAAGFSPRAPRRDRPAARRSAAGSVTSGSRRRCGGCPRPPRLPRALRGPPGGRA